MSTKNKLTHIDASGQPQMVNISDKIVTKRTARAQAVISLPPEVQNALKDGEINSKKGPVFQTAIIAGTQAVKRTDELIPFCHALPIEGIDFETDIGNGEAIITCAVSVTAKTGVEMEALTGASAAALTVYDMCKALSHDIVISEIKLLSKTGGKSDYAA